MRVVRASVQQGAAFGGRTQPGVGMPPSVMSGRSSHLAQIHGEGWMGDPRVKGGASSGDFLKKGWLGFPNNIHTAPHHQSSRNVLMHATALCNGMVRT
jgi:hypothetical protein